MNRIIFYDHPFGYSGYAKAVRELAYALSITENVSIIPHKPVLNYLPERIFPLLSAELPDKDDFVIWRTYFAPFPTTGKLIANIALESTRLPERMVKEANDERVVQVWCPSEFCKKNYINSGIVEEKIEVIPHGFTPFQCPAKPEGLPFTFLFIGGYVAPGDRKGADILSLAFREEFAKEIAEKKVQLYLKVNPSYATNIPVDTIKGDGIIVDINSYVDSEMPKILGIADCYVMPTWGEAFDMSILEAAAAGLPIIASQNGGQFDYLEKMDRVLLIGGTSTPAKYSSWDCGNWVKPDIEQLKKHMRYAFEQRQSRSKHTGIDSWSWSEAAKKAVKALNKVR